MPQSRYGTTFLVAAMTTLALAGSTLAAAPTAAKDVHGVHQPVQQAKVNRVLRDARIVESSGLTRSTYKRHVLFTHNDSGDGPRVFAVGHGGRTRAVLTIKHAKARDWEDMSRGPRHTLWVGDIGDNAGRRSTIQVYRFREPKNLRSRTMRSTRFRFVYPDGPRDAEGLMVNPQTGRIYIVSKEPRGTVYVAPRKLSTTRVNRLIKVRRAPATVTAADFAPGGKAFALATYSSVYLYPGLRKRPSKRPAPQRDQGESISFSRNGKGIFLGSEGSRSPVYGIPR